MDLYNQLADMASSNTSKTFEFNHNEALLNRKWQEQMSNSAHQREVKDLQQAGLNPVLSAMNGSGASTPSGSSASGSADSSAISALASLATSAISANAQITSAGISAQAMRDVAETSYKSNKYSVDNPTNLSLGGAIWRMFGGSKTVQKVKSELSRDKTFSNHILKLQNEKSNVHYRDLKASEQIKLASFLDNNQDMRLNRIYLLKVNPTI